MRDSCINAGFDTVNCEYLVIDNTSGNQYDAYRGIKYFIQNSEAAYIIICHQDVLFQYDGIEQLLDTINELHTLDPNWAIAGNAGGDDRYDRHHIRITDPHGSDVSNTTFPKQVSSLDENFILLRNGTGISTSNDLDGFHLYATDLCLNAIYNGYTCYVVDFHIHHLSGGCRDNAFYNCRDALVTKNSRFQKGKFVKTPSTHLFLSASKILNAICNTHLFYRMKSCIDRLLNTNR
jgi:hypothetical protein